MNDKKVCMYCEIMYGYLVFINKSMADYRKKYRWECALESKDLKVILANIRLVSKIGQIMNKSKTKTR